MRRVGKNIKTPLKMLQGMNKAQGRRDGARDVHLRNVGLGDLVNKKARVRDDLTVGDGGMANVKSSIGRYKGGMLTVSKYSIKEAKRDVKPNFKKMFKK
jgi:hypothetical protein